MILDFTVGLVAYLPVSCSITWGCTGASCGMVFARAPVKEERLVPAPRRQCKCCSCMGRFLIKRTCSIFFVTGHAATHVVGRRHFVLGCPRQIIFQRHTSNPRVHFKIAPRGTIAVALLRTSAKSSSLPSMLGLCMHLGLWLVFVVSGPPLLGTLTIGFIWHPWHVGTVIELHT